MDSCLIRGLIRVTRIRYSHILIYGDFNLHNLEVSAWPSEQFKADLQELIVNVLLYNHVTTHTRFKTVNKPSILDLVLTNEERMIDKLLMDSPLGLSDHVVITFEYVCYAEYPSEHSELTHTITRYHVLKELADAASWEFSNKSPLYNVWAEFVNKLSDIVNKASEIKPLCLAKMPSSIRSDSRSDPANYRPVTLLPVLAKVMEAVVAEALMDYLEKCNILVAEQHGFRQHRSCTTNLLIARGSWTEVADDGVGVDVIYLDFSKAFDRLDHRILLQRLQSYGIGDPLLGWIGNFLYQRKLQVRVRGSLSNPIEVECGVPQGSVLGPRLFLVFINDLVRVISSNFLLFADEVKIWRAISNKTDQDLLQHELDCIYNGTMEQWYMTGKKAYT
ncbi:unnamed protein product [Dicrocoelium dendriticum]|nr:unnamed protein product [Dicrocoelium dendriticum]